MKQQQEKAPPIENNERTSRNTRVRLVKLRALPHIDIAAKPPWSMTNVPKQFGSQETNRALWPMVKPASSLKIPNLSIFMRSLNPASIASCHDPATKGLRVCQCVATPRARKFHDMED
jgi:hypothetical protein